MLLFIANFDKGTIKLLKKCESVSTEYCEPLLPDPNISIKNINCFKQ